MQPVFKTKTDQTFTYIDAFLQGFRSNEVLPSAQNCSKGLRDSINTWNYTKQSFQNSSNPLYNKSTQQTFAYTHWISYNLAPASRNCFLTGMQGYLYAENKTEQFAAGNSSFFSSWMSSVLGNSITLNSIYKKISDAKAANDTVATYYWYGRLANILVIFNPLKEDNFEEPAVNTKGKKLLADMLTQFTSAAKSQHKKSKPKPLPDASLITDSSNTTDEEAPPAEKPDLGNVFYDAYFFLRGV